MKTAACRVVVPAAGAGSRMAAAMPKQYLSLLGRSVIELTLSRLLEHPAINGITLVLSPDDDWWPYLPLASDPRIKRVDGGAERCHSVLNGLRSLYTEADEQDWVLVHDAARPCIRVADIDRLIREVSASESGGLLAVPLHDTVKLAGAGSSRIERTLPRDRLWRAFTPQMFRLGALRSALEAALANRQLVTDEASAMELAGHRPLLVEGAGDNIKITRPGDLALAEFYLRQQEREH